MKKITLLLIATVLSVSLFAQKSFLGKLTFTLDVTGEGAEMVKGMMPDNYEYLVGKQGMLFKMNGGVMASMLGDILITMDGNTYIINHTEKSVMEIKDQGTETEDAKPKIELQDEKTKLLGYECKKYKVTTTSEEGEVVQYIWVTDAYKIDVKPKNQGSNPGSSIMFDGVTGIPLKIEANIGEMGIVLLASELKEEVLPKTTFEVPTTYEKKDFDPSKMLGF